MISETANRAASISPGEYCHLATLTVAGHGYSRLPQELLQAEQAINCANKSAAAAANRILCRYLLDAFTLEDSPWAMPDAFHYLYQNQLERIGSKLNDKDNSYFSLSNDPFLKDLAILRHRLIPFGAELATPFSGVSKRLLLKFGWRQAGKFIRIIVACHGFKPFLELHMHPQCTVDFTPEGWLASYENLADFLVLNQSFLGVQSSSWFLDPALEQISPHLAYLRQVPERCGAAILYAGEDDTEYSGAFATSQSRLALYKAGHYQPRLFTRIWPRQSILQRAWRDLGSVNLNDTLRDRGHG